MAALRHLAAGPAYRHHGRRGGSSSLLLPPLRLLHPGPTRSPVSSNNTNVGAPWKVLGAARPDNVSLMAPVAESVNGQVFMDLTTFEESWLNEADVGDKQKWLKEMDCNLLYWSGKIIDFELPITVRLTVTDTDPGVSHSAQGGTKLATLETGAVVTVPSFVNVCDDILVDSRTGQYMNRA